MTEKSMCVCVSVWDGNKNPKFSAARLAVREEEECEQQKQTSTSQYKQVNVSSELFLFPLMFHSCLINSYSLLTTMAKVAKGTFSQS